MRFRSKLRRVVVLGLAFGVGLWVCDRWLAASRADAQAATTLPTTAPATRPALPANVQPIADRLAAIYAKRPLRVEATIVSDFDVAGIVETKTVSIVGIARDANVYKHQAVDKLLVADDGKTLHLFDRVKNEFADTRHSEDSAAATAARDAARRVLLEQDPALFIATGNDAAAALSLEGEAVVLIEPATEAGRSFDRVESRHAGTVRQVWIDRDAGTIDRVTYDFAKMLEGQGAAAVKRATATIRYAKTQLSTPAADDSAFAFAAPADATPMELARPHGEMLRGEPSALEGKPAPAFELKNLDGASVKLSDLKGSVVVLDFWATWCPPCREGLPHVAALGAAMKDKGVKVLAVNQQEDRETVAKFLTAQKLELVALLDADGAVGGQYGVSGIPQTVVIDRDGKVRKVTVGFDPNDTTTLQSAVDAALK